MRKFCAPYLIWVGLLLNLSVYAYDIEFYSDTWRTNGVSAGGYESNIPKAWSYNGDFNILADRSGIANTNALKFYFYNASKDQVGNLRMGTGLCIPSGDVVCDNVVATMTIYVQPLQSKTVDTFQLVATTNDWNEADIIPIGDPIPIRDSSYKTGWRTFTIKRTIPGISQSENYSAFRIGVKATAGGYSTTYGYLHGISVAFMACATPSTPVLMSATADNPDTDIPLNPDEEIEPGVEYGRMKVAVNVSPVDKIEGLVVTGVLSRVVGDRTITVSNELENVGGVYYEKLDTVTNRLPFDAGEQISYYAFAKYRTTGGIDPLGKVGEDGYAYEFSDSAEYSVGKKGSVWVNEIGVVGSDCYVELCGTTNRSYRGGWAIVLSGHTNVFEKAFDFASNMTNGFNDVVGSETYKLEGWGNIELQNASLELINPAGVVEFTRNISMPGHYQMKGRAEWHGATDDDWSYDWTGTATDDTFEFVHSDDVPSFGSVNVGQGFVVPIKAMMYFATVIENDDGTKTMLPYAAVTSEVMGIRNGEDGSTKFSGQTGDGENGTTRGTAEIEIIGYSDDASSVLMTNSVSAFGWKSDVIVTNVSLYGDVYLTNNVRPTVAFDGFSGLNAYWESSSSIRNNLNNIMYWETKEVDGDKVLQLDTRSGYLGSASLTTKSYIDLRGKRRVDISFEFRNERNYGVLADCVTMEIILADTANFSGTTVETVGLANKSASYGSGEWYSFREIVEVPEGFAVDGKIWVRINATKKASTTSVYTTIDNLRVAALDSVEVNSLEMPDLPDFENSKFPFVPPNDVRLVLTPLTGGIVTNYNENISYDVTTNDVAVGTFGSLAEYEAFLAGMSEIEGELVVSTVTNVERTVKDVITNLVRDVSANLMVKIGDGEVFPIPFHFADGLVTNHIYASQETATMTIDPFTMADAIASNREEHVGGFLPGDTVQYYVKVFFDPDDADDSENRENFRYLYYPDNSTATDNGWYVKGDYLPAVRSFDVGGPEISNVGELEITDNGVTVNYHAWSESTITNLAVSIATNGVDVLSDEQGTNGMSRVTNTFTTDRLEPNTDYVLTISGNSATRPLASTNFAFTTLPVVTSVTVEAVSQTETRLTVNGSAAGYVVPAGWTQTSLNTWTRNDGTPNTLVSATGIYGTNKFGQASATIDATPAYTLAAVATTAPEISKGATTVFVKASDDMAYDGNPEWTEYAVRVTTSSGGDTLVTTNDVQVWKTLSDWKNDDPVEVRSPQIDIAATNYFSFITRNGDEVVTQNSAPVTTNCWFDMAAEFADVPAQMDAASQGDSSFGKVAVPLVFFDPAQSEGAMASVEYRIDRGEWTPWMDFPVSFDELSVTTNLEWDAWAAVGGVEGEYVFNLRTMVSAGNRKSEWAVFEEGTLDFAPPTGLAISGTPENGTTTKSTGYDFTFSADDTHDVSYGWTLDGASGTSAETSGSVAAGYGSHTLTVVATDAMGNASDPMTWSWTVDTLSPEWCDPALSGDPEEGVVTNLTAFSFTASATDDTELSYHWALNGTNVTGVTGATFEGVAAEGTNTVSVFAEDTVGNKCDPIVRTWIVDTGDPEVTDVKGLPAALTNVKRFTLTAEASDKLTEIAGCFWSFNNGPFEEGDNTYLVVTTTDGLYSVRVYVKDQAGNASAIYTVNWTLDATPPADLTIAGTPAAGVATKDTAFSFTATAMDDSLPIAYNWTLFGPSGAIDASDVGAEFVGDVVAEGTNTVSVYAVDKAGNVSDTNTLEWVVDYTAPSIAVTGVPDSPTKIRKFTLTAEATDNLTQVSYFWSFNGSSFEVGAHTYDVDTESMLDGDYNVRVYAVDEAGNASATNTVNWKLDTNPPRILSVVGTSGVVGTTNFTFTVSAEDDSLPIAYRWTLNGIEANENGATFNGFVDEGTNTVGVSAIDAAGNESDTEIHEWVVDITPPENLAVAGTPADKSFTNVAEFFFVASATDDTNLSYHWTTNGVDATSMEASISGVGIVSMNTVSVYATDEAGNSSTTNTLTWTYDPDPPSKPEITAQPDEFTDNGIYSVTANSTDPLSGVSGYFWSINNGEFTFGEATFGGEVYEENVYTARVYAVDNAGNVSETNECSWTYDVTPPSMPGFDLKPDEFTNVREYNFKVKSEDNVSGISGYYWSLNGSEFAFRGDAFEGSVSVDGTNTVRVYAKDGAGNVSTTNSWTWIYDATKPTVTLSTDTPEYFNQALVPMVVTVEFGETVTNFTADSVYVTNKTDVVVAPLGVATNIYTVTITPNGDGEVSVLIPAGVVADYASNLNEASAPLTRTYDTTPPKVTIESTTPEPPALLNIGDMPFEVTVTFDEAVTSFTADDLIVENGRVVEFTGSQEPDKNNMKFIVAITNANEEVTSISVSIAAGAVTDRAGNRNDASNVLIRDCDVKRPEIIWGKLSYENTDAPIVRFRFSEEVTNCTESAITRTNAKISKFIHRDDGIYTVTITVDGAQTNMTFQIKAGAVTDNAGNGNVASEILVFTKKEGTGWDLTKESETPTTSDIEFGGYVKLQVDPETGATNEVSFTSIDFKPGAACSLTMSGFTATTEDISDLQMWFWVKDTLDGKAYPVRVNAEAKFESGELTVTLRAEATEGKNSFFIIGIDNKGE